VRHRTNRYLNNPSEQDQTNFETCSGRGQIVTNTSSPITADCTSPLSFHHGDQHTADGMTQAMLIA
jgi:hypothetical protein